MTTWRDYPIRVLDLRPGMYLRPVPTDPAPARVTRIVIASTTVDVALANQTYLSYPITATVRVHVPDSPITDDTIIDDDLEPVAQHRHLALVTSTEAL